MKRVLVGGFHHESNSFSKIKSGIRDFRITRGQGILANLSPNNSLTGIVSGLQEQGYEPVPSLYMRGVPNGEVDSDFFREVKEEFLALAEKEVGKIDAITLALHGSMRVAGLGEVEGLILEELRKLFPEIPIFFALDMHATISEKMYRYSDGFVGYKTAPHTDCTETGRKAAEMTVFALETGRLPETALVKVPMLLAGEKSGTDVEPMRSLIAGLYELEKNPDVLSASYLLGFPWADNPDSSVSVSVVTKKTAEKAEKLAKELAEVFWQKRQEFSFVTEAYGEEEAVERAFSYLKENTRPVYLSDSGDNPTAGASSDNTKFLSYLTGDARVQSKLQKLKSPLIYAGFYDPESVQKCESNLGKTIRLEIGGRFDDSRPPVPLEGEVRNYIKDYSYAGLQGAVALFFTNHIHIILSEKHIGYTEPRLMEALGLKPEQADIIVCKLGYLTPGHRALAGKSILVLTEGNTNEDLESIAYQHIPRPIYPLDKDFSYDADDYLMEK